MVSPRRTTTAPEACLASRPVSREMVLPPIVRSTIANFFVDMLGVPTCCGRGWGASDQLPDRPEWVDQGGVPKAGRTPEAAHPETRTPLLDCAGLRAGG